MVYSNPQDPKMFHRLSLKSSEFLQKFGSPSQCCLSCCEVKLHTNTTRKSHNHKILLQNQKSLLYFTDMVSIVKLLRNTTFDCLFSNQYGNWRKLGLLYFVLSLNTWYTWFLFSALIDENFGYFNF